MLSIRRTLLVALLGLTLALGLIAALGVAGLYDARQDYEDALAETYVLESRAARLLALGVIEEAALQARGSGAADARRRAAQAFDAEASAAAALAEGDRASERLVRSRVRAQRRARRVATRPPQRARGGVDPVASALLDARGLSGEIIERQAERRAAARDRAEDETRSAVTTIALAGGLALLAALALVGALVTRMRRPLDELLDATSGLARGRLERRVDPSGPRELRELGDAFNSMATDLSRAQERIESERRKLALTVSSLGDALVTTDHEGRVTTLNPRARELLPQLRTGTSAGDGAGPLPPLEQALAGEVLVEAGERTLAVTAARLEDGDEGAVWTVRDISERARLERLKSEFVATASHELRSPLTSIKGFAELLSRSEALSERQREFVDVILISTNRLVALVNDLLEVARAEAGKIELHRRPVDLGELVHEIATLLRPRIADKRQTLTVEVPARLPRAYADAARVRQIVTNLLTNAHLYTGEGGQLGVRLREDDQQLVLSVADDGRGMTPDELEHVFDRFYRGGEAAGPGSGLGLSIVKSLVELHEGEIAVESEPGRGSVFTVRLPRDADPGDGGAPRLALRGKRVLVVDDERDVAELIARQLEAYGVRSAIAGDGAEAIERLRSEYFDAVTLDVFMPRKDGFEVLRELRADAELRRLPIVVVSVLSGRDALAGEWSVSKPIDADELADALGGAVLAGRTRVLVVGRAELRERLEPALERIGLEHHWVTSAAAAARACKEHRFEVALVDAGMRSPQASLAAIDLRGRRLRRTVVLVSAGDDAPGIARLGPEPVPLEEAAAAVLDALGTRARDG